MQDTSGWPDNGLHRFEDDYAIVKTAPPPEIVERFKLDTAYYKKYADANGYPILSSGKVPDAALAIVWMRKGREAGAGSPPTVSAVSVPLFVARDAPTKGAGAMSNGQNRDSTCQSTWPFPSGCRLSR